ncbi:MAG: DUF4445 domain-containing protein [Lentisphaerae bacterium]|jgi:uncharacterized 2Fe-2S/4Fe-4S cluster protein (DUF4445 family)|nr:DUF4445 domain-containing protein [Lentisphaerota bacterium]
MRLFISERGRPLSAILAERGASLDTRCGGAGTCGRCRVSLLSGRWDVAGRAADAPLAANACQARLLSDSGEIDVPESSFAPRNGRIAAEWNAPPLPATPETVAAVDVGTTTVAAVKIRDGAVVATASAFNAQSRFGDNVIARIHHAGGSAAQLAELQSAIAETINALLAEIGAEDAVRIAVAGNTVMTCLLHGIDPASIGVMPFTPPRRRFAPRPAAALGLRHRGAVLTLPCISGYIGGDIVAGIAETGLGPGEMLVDIGTNCEIVFDTGNGVVCAAAAAGPAFEGAGIVCGCRAVEGAIDHYAGNGDFEVIGGVAPKGLCGSAMVDFLAVERRLGHLNACGRLQPPAPSFTIAPGIVIVEGDIEQLLKAKAAVHAGIATLEDHCGRPADRLFLAGGFAKYLDRANAVAIGMLPDRPSVIVGNTSLAGAARVACEPESLARLESYIDLPVERPLNTLPGFEDNFIDGLLLP